MFFKFNYIKLVILSDIFWSSLWWRYFHSIGWTSSLTLCILRSFSLWLWTIWFLWIYFFIVRNLVSCWYFYLFIWYSNGLDAIISIWCRFRLLCLRLFNMLAHFLILINIIFLISLLIIIVDWAGYMDFWLFNRFFYCILTAFLCFFCATLILLSFLWYFYYFVLTKATILFVSVIILINGPLG